MSWGKLGGTSCFYINFTFMNKFRFGNWKLEYSKEKLTRGSSFKREMDKVLGSLLQTLTKLY